MPPVISGCRRRVPRHIRRSIRRQLVKRAGRRLLFALFRLAAFALCFEALRAAFGAVGGAFHEFGANEFDHRHFGAVALAWSEASDPGVAAMALAETRAERVEK